MSFTRIRLHKNKHKDKKKYNNNPFLNFRKFVFRSISREKIFHFDPILSSIRTERNGVCARDTNRQVKRDYKTKPKLYFRALHRKGDIAMIDAFRKDFSRLQRGRLTDRRTDGRNSAGIDSALKRFLFFESTRTRGEEVIKNLSRIWRPFFFIGVLHFPRCTTIFHR